MEKYKNKAIASMVMGIISVAFCVMGYSSIIGLVLGVLALVFSMQIRNASRIEGFIPNGMVTAGYVLGIIGIVMSSIVFVSCVSCASCGGCTSCVQSCAYGCSSCAYSCMPFRSEYFYQW